MSYNSNAKTPREILDNCRFQLDNIDGYLLMAADRNEPPTAAKIKADCLLSETQKLIESLSAALNPPNDQELSHAAGDFRQPETRSEN